MADGSGTQERARSVKTEHTQKASDEELFDKAKLDPKKLDKATQSRIVDACLRFGEAISGFTLYPYEVDFARRIIWDLITNGGETITGEFARQGGKSTTMGIVSPSVVIMLPLIAEYMKLMGIVTPITKFCDGFLCGIYGPDYERAGIIGGKINRIISSDRAKSILEEPEIGMSFPSRLTTYTDNMPRNSRIVVKSANKRVSIEGETYHLVITDETQEISDYVLKKSISPMLAATNGTTVHIGSAFPRKVYFYDVGRINKQADLHRSAKMRCHYEVNYRVVQKYNPNYKKYIDKEKAKLGEFSDEFRMSYELYWPLERGMYITEDQLIRLCGGDYWVTNSDLFNDHVIGIDLAKSSDSTVVTVLEVDWDSPVVVDAESRIIRHKKVVKNWLEIGGVDYDQQFYMIRDFVGNYLWSRMVVDATGVGAPMCDRLINAFPDKVVTPFVFNRPEKSYGYSLLLKELTAPRLLYPDSARAKTLRKQRRFVDQMTNLAKRYEGGYLVVEHESEAGKDDYPDSLMLAVYGVEEEVEVEAEELLENIYLTGLVEHRNRSALTRDTHDRSIFRRT